MAWQYTQCIYYVQTNRTLWTYLHLFEDIYLVRFFSCIVETNMDYRERLAKLIKDKTGQEIDFNKIRNTFERWIEKMRKDREGIKNQYISYHNNKAWFEIEKLLNMWPRSMKPQIYSNSTVFFNKCTQLNNWTPSYYSLCCAHTFSAYISWVLILPVRYVNVFSRCSMSPLSHNNLNSIIAALFGYHFYNYLYLITTVFFPVVQDLLFIEASSYRIAGY